MRGFDRNAAMNLKACRSKLTKQQYRTLKGQILAGDPDGAMYNYLFRLLSQSLYPLQYYFHISAYSPCPFLIFYLLNILLQEVFSLFHHK